MQWIPLTKKELYQLIGASIKQLNPIELKFWESIAILPEKWIEKEYGAEGGGFWVVAITEAQVVWYNDIEEGFNVSGYKEYGIIAEYGAEQDELQWIISRMIRF